MAPLMLELGRKKSQHLNESSPLICLNWNPYNLKALFKNVAYCRHSALVRIKIQAQENSNWAPAISNHLKQFLLYLLLSSLVLRFSLHSTTLFLSSMLLHSSCHVKKATGHVSTSPHLIYLTFMSLRYLICAFRVSALNKHLSFSYSVESCECYKRPHSATLIFRNYSHWIILIHSYWKREPTVRNAFCKTKL